MRIALGCMMHESNTFTCLRTGDEAFTITTGAGFLDVPRWRKSGIMGIYETLKGANATVVPLAFARALPSGTVRRETYDRIKQSMLESLQATLPLDGLALALHGSMCVEGLYDPEGDLLEAIRQIVGDDLPIVCALDMHATLTARMIAHADAFSAYRTAPHIDEYETGIRAARMLLDSLHQKRRLTTAFTRIPFLISGEQSETSVDPAKSLFEALTVYDEQPGIACASYVMGFPWADSPHGGAGALACGWREDQPALQTLSLEMARCFWARRNDFTYSTQALMPEEALNEARRSSLYPVLLSDAGDNPTAGATQDTTGLLRLMLRMGIENAIFACLVDPEALWACQAAQPGSMLSLEVGGGLSGDVREGMALSGKLLATVQHEGTAYAALQAGGIVVVLCDRRCAVYDPEVLRVLGLVPEQYRMLALKTGYMSPAFQSIGKRAILALTPGDTSLDLTQLPYEKTPRPIYPLDTGDDVFQEE